jgi:hypothetical protein
MRSSKSADYPLVPYSGCFGGENAPLSQEVRTKWPAGTGVGQVIIVGAVGRLRRIPGTPQLLLELLCKMAATLHRRDHRTGHSGKRNDYRSSAWNDDRPAAIALFERG